MHYKKIKKCRICNSKKIKKILSLGNQCLSGVFPESKEQKILKAPLDLVVCNGKCGLVQLSHTVNPKFLYGDNYGYRSGINHTMRKHLKYVVEVANRFVSIKRNESVLDIGSNDGTLLKNYKEDIVKFGFDPCASKYVNKYPKNSFIFFDYFDKKNIRERRKFKVITSIAMFYDLNNPKKFVEDINDCLDDDGIWITEQSYMPKMINNGSYDTICHEHLGYYGVYPICYLLNKCSMQIVHMERNPINGGSLLMVIKKGRGYCYSNRQIHYIDIFKKRIMENKKELINLLFKLKNNKKKVFGYGASTKGNVILQYCNLTYKDIPFIADRNPEKYGKYTPGSKIEIVSESVARHLKPDYFLVLPWHFRDEIIKREKNFLSKGGKLIFPLPKLEVVSK